MNYTKVLKIIRQSGILIESLLPNSHMVEKKGFSNFVTNIDYEIQDFLMASLKRLSPKALYLAEETLSTIGDIAEIKDKDIWIIDPIDGTTNLMYKFPHFSISLAHFRNGKPIFGTIYNPITKELFYAEKGKGAYLNGTRIKVTENNKIKDTLLGFGFPYDKSKIDTLTPIINKIVKNCRDLRRTGSAALDLAYVASSRLDGYFEFDLEIWDYAAGAIILEEAGGKITDWNNQELKFNQKINILSSNTHIHKALVEYIQVNDIIL